MDDDQVEVMKLAAAMSPYALTVVRDEMAERLRLIGSNGAIMIRSSKLREWIAIINDAISARAVSDSKQGGRSDGRH